MKFHFDIPSEVSTSISTDLSGLSDMSSPSPPAKSTGGKRTYTVKDLPTKHSETKSGKSVASTSSSFSRTWQPPSSVSTASSSKSTHEPQSFKAKSSSEPQNQPKSLFSGLKFASDLVSQSIEEESSSHNDSTQSSSSSYSPSKPSALSGIKFASDLLAPKPEIRTITDQADGKQAQKSASASTSALASTSFGNIKFASDLASESKSQSSSIKVKHEETSRGNAQVGTTPWLTGSTASSIVSLAEKAETSASFEDTPESGSNEGRKKKLKGLSAAQRILSRGSPPRGSAGGRSFQTGSPAVSSMEGSIVDEVEEDLDQSNMYEDTFEQSSTSVVSMASPNPGSGMKTQHGIKKPLSTVQSVPLALQVASSAEGSSGGYSNASPLAHHSSSSAGSSVGGTNYQGTHQANKRSPLPASKRHFATQTTVPIQIVAAPGLSQAESSHPDGSTTQKTSKQPLPSSQNPVTASQPVHSSLVVQETATIHSRPLETAVQFLDAEGWAYKNTIEQETRRWAEERASWLRARSTSIRAESEAGKQQLRKSQAATNSRWGVVSFESTQKFISRHRPKNPLTFEEALHIVREGL